MKSLIGLLVLVFSFTLFAFPNGYPTQETYNTQVDLDTAEAALDVVEAQVGASTVNEGLEGFGIERILIVNYDSDTDASSASESSAWAYTIPAKSIITQVGLVADVLPSASDTAFRISAKCESAQDLLADQNLIISSISTASVLEGVVKVEDSATHIYTASGCIPEWAVHASDDVDASGSAADVNLFLRYTQMQ